MNIFRIEFNAFFLKMNQDLMSWLEEPFNNELLELGAVGLHKKRAKTYCTAPHKTTSLKVVNWPLLHILLSLWHYVM